MKLTLKLAIALAILTAAATAYAAVPDVSKWSCSGSGFKNDYGIELMTCDNSGSHSLYMKVSGEPVYIHEHRRDADKTVYYNALKTNEGNWVEIVNKMDLLFYGNETEEGKGITVHIINEKGGIIAKRFIPLLIKK